MVALVERQEAPLGIVYGSDAVASQKVKVVGVFLQIPINLLNTQWQLLKIKITKQPVIIMNT